MMLNLIFIDKPIYY